MADIIDHRAGQDRAVGYWLLSVAFLVFVMVVVGGITRLTESGLSMVDWRPVSGVLPPMTEEAWQAEFDKYRAFPEYRVLNRGMSLAEFKTIFWWEYIHRLLGRLIGVAFMLPLIVFWLRRQIPAGYGPKLVGLFVLGGLQGLLGWYMVRSGLVDVPEVSHYRLTAHLALALAIFAAILWVALDLLCPHHRSDDATLRPLSFGFLGLLAAQILLGGLVAGLKAGYVFNTWPLMGETFVPAGYWAFTPWWANLLDNPAAVQFNHRILAYAVTIFAFVLLAVGIRRGLAGPARQGLIALAAVVTAQLLLGILTVVMAVPVSVGAAHQAGAVLVLAAGIYLAHTLRRSEA